MHEQTANIHQKLCKIRAMKNKYFTLEGAYFQQGNSPVEDAINVVRALKQIRLYFEQGYSDWEEALEYLNEVYGRSMIPETRAFREAIGRDDDTLARFYANRIIRRAQRKNI